MANLPSIIEDARLDSRFLPILETNPRLLRFIQRKNSAITMKTYLRWIIEILGPEPDKFLEHAKLDPAWAEEFLASYVERQKGRVWKTNPKRKITAVTILGSLAPVRSLCEDNRVFLAWHSLRGGLPKPTKVARDRPPTLHEMRAFMKVAHIREKFIGAALVSSGGRVGLFHHPLGLGGYGIMKLSHITMVHLGNGKELSCLDWLAQRHDEGTVIAKLTVYPAEVEEYPSFWSIEAVDNFRVYMDARDGIRERFNEDTPVVRDAWNPAYHPEGAYPLLSKSISTAIAKTWGLSRVWKPALEGGFKAAHGFRKYFETEGKRMVGAVIPDETMENHITADDIEILKGKRMNYNKPTLYLQKVFIIIQPRLLIDEKYEALFKLKKGEEELKAKDGEFKKERESWTLQMSELYASFRNYQEKMDQRIDELTKKDS